MTRSWSGHIITSTDCVSRWCYLQDKTSRIPGTGGWTRLLVIGGGWGRGAILLIFDTHLIRTFGWGREGPRLRRACPQLPLSLFDSEWQRDTTSVSTAKYLPPNVLVIPVPGTRTARGMPLQHLCTTRFHGRLPQAILPDESHITFLGIPACSPLSWLPKPSWIVGPLLQSQARILELALPGPVPARVEFTRIMCSSKTAKVSPRWGLHHTCFTRAGPA